MQSKCRCEKLAPFSKKPSKILGHTIKWKLIWPKCKKVTKNADWNPKNVKLYLGGKIQNGIFPTKIWNFWYIPITFWTTLCVWFSDDLTCKSVPMNASGGHFWSPFGQLVFPLFWPLSTFLEGGEPTKPLIKDPLVKPIFATSFGVKEARLAVTSKPKTTFHSWSYWRILHGDRKSPKKYHFTAIELHLKNNSKNWIHSSLQKFWTSTLKNMLH